MDPRAALLNVALLLAGASACGGPVAGPVAAAADDDDAVAAPPSAVAATVAACSRRPDPAWLTQVYDAKSAAAATADDGVFAYVEATLFGVLCTLADDRFMPVPAMADVQPQWTRGPRGGLFAYEHVLERGGCRWRVLIDRSESPELFAVWEELLRAEQARQKAGS